jgi:hypothetical protein
MSQSKALYISTKAGTLTLGLGGHTNLSFDGEGRLVGAWMQKITYRRTLDNRVLAKWMGQDGERRRRFLGDDERQWLLDACYEQARAVACAIRQGAVAVDARRDAILSWLERVDGWDWPRLEAETQRFGQIYRPIPILPPDQYLSVVVQATEGCSYNECSFCTFYQDRPFRIKGEAALESHLAQVQAFLGRGMAMRRSVFLADANAVLVAQPRLLAMLAQVGRAWPQGLDGQGEPPPIYAFMSAPDAQHKSGADFAALAAHNLRRVYVGMESGHDPLRSFLRKPGGADAVLDAVEKLKAGGLSVGLMVMVGVGGERFRIPHFEDSLALLQRMPLGPGDLVYWSPFVPSPDAPYLADMAAAQIPALSPAAIRAEIARFREALRPWTTSQGVQQSLYDIREFVY